MGHRRRAAAPLPVRDGVGPARLRLQGGNVAEEFGRRFGSDAREAVLAGGVVDARGSVVDGMTELPAGAVVYLYRDLPEEVEVPFDIPVLYRDDNILVVDKPHFLATMPRGRQDSSKMVINSVRERSLS